MNTLGKAVMAEDSERKKFNLLRDGHWKRFYIEVNVAALFQMDHENPGKLSRQISNDNIGFMLDTMDLVHLPLFNSGFYYLMVVNFKKNVFQILHPNRKIHLIKDEADIAVKQFKMSFKIAYKNSAINIDAMETVFQSVCSTERDGDSGVFVMKMICDYNAEKTFWFEPEHAKPIREILTYYMLAHPSNEKMPLQTKKILDRHGIAYDYKSPGYTPWKSQQSEASSQDSIERMLIF